MITNWTDLERNLMIKRVHLIDSKNHPVLFERVQANSNEPGIWYNLDYPVMDEYIQTMDLCTKYDSYSIVGFYSNGTQPKHVCGYYTLDKCPECPVYVYG
jgi:hypothetical protein